MEIVQPAVIKLSKNPTSKIAKVPLSSNKKKSKLLAMFNVHIMYTQKSESRKNNTEKTLENL